MLKVYGEDSSIYNVLSVFGEQQDELVKHSEDFKRILEDRGENFIDSHRIARVMFNFGVDREALEVYETLVSCCGSDEMYITIKGELYVIGYNFGH